MSHQSNGDANAHYSVQGETAAGIKVKGGHAAEDSSKQTVSLPSPFRFLLEHAANRVLPTASQLSTRFRHRGFIARVSRCVLRWRSIVPFYVCGSGSRRRTLLQLIEVLNIGICILPPPTFIANSASCHYSLRSSLNVCKA